jgi:hypothetical protein
MGSLLAFVGSTLVEESLVMIGLLVVMGGILFEESKVLLPTNDVLPSTSGFLVKMVLEGCCLLAMALIKNGGIKLGHLCRTERWV